MKRTLTAAAVLAALTAALSPSAASASISPRPLYTGGRDYAVGSAGYIASGAQFRFAAATAYLRDPSQYSAITNGVGWGVTLKSASLEFDVGVSDTTTSGTQYSPAVDVYQNGTLLPGAPDYNATWCPAGGTCQPASSGGSFPVGDTVTQSIFYDTGTGAVQVTAYDKAGNAFTFTYNAGTGQSFTQADAGAGFGSFTAPAATTKLVSLTGVSLTTYNGKHSGMASWFAHSKQLATSNGTGSGTLQAEPSDLTAGGSSFSVSFVP